MFPETSERTSTAETNTRNRDRLQEKGAYSVFGFEDTRGPATCSGATHV